MSLLWVIAKSIDTDLPEYIIDTITSNEVLKDIPIVSTIVSGTKVFLSISDKMLYKKIEEFIKSLNKISLTARKNFLEKLNSSEEKRISEQLLLIIDKVDEFEKMNLIARIFWEYIQTNIEKEEFLKLCLIINKGFFQDIMLLKKEVLLENDKQILFNIWLMNIKKWNIWTMVHIWVPLAWSAFQFSLNKEWEFLKKLVQQL